MTLEVIHINIINDAQCWGCGNRGESDKFCELQGKGSLWGRHSICLECYENNINNKIKECINCDGAFILDYTKLKINDKIKFGFDEFLYCYNCLRNKEKKECVGYYGRLDELEDENSKYFDFFYEECIKPKFKNINDKKMRIIGQTSFNFKEETNNIKKKINNCIRNDNTKFKIKGDITYEYIYQLLQIQKYKCHICNELILTDNYKPYCCNQFSIDRIDNTLPHNKNNVKISCYFCNCKNNNLYDKKKKICDILDCNCHNLLN